MRQSLRIPTHAPVLEAVYDCPEQPAPTGYRRLCRWELAYTDKAPTQKEPLFLVSDAPRPDTSPLFEVYCALSPDGRYYYCSEYLDLTRRGVYEATTFLSVRTGALPKQLPIPALFEALFSPNSKWLCGVALTPRLETGAEYDNFYCVECASGKVRRLRKAPKGLEGVGWYPDSLHLWYAVRDAARRLQVFKLNTRTGRQVLLRGAEAQAPFRDWDLLDPRYRSASLDGMEACVYALKRAVRVRLELDSRSETVAEVIVEWRTGRVQRIVRRGEQPWACVRPLDISEDGQWVLLEERVRASGSAEGLGQIRVVALHTGTMREFSYAYSSSEEIPRWRFARPKERVRE